MSRYTILLLLTLLKTVQRPAIPKHFSRRHKNWPHHKSDQHQNWQSTKAPASRPLPPFTTRIPTSCTSNTPDSTTDDTNEKTYGAIPSTNYNITTFTKIQIHYNTCNNQRLTRNRPTNGISSMSPTSHP